jgi:hypothetical protein
LVIKTFCTIVDRNHVEVVSEVVVEEEDVGDEIRQRTASMRWPTFKRKLLQIQTLRSKKTRASRYAK